MLGARIESHPNTALKYLRTALTAVPTVYIDMGVGYRLNMAERPHIFQTTLTRKKVETNEKYKA
jgi:hypothetical protein